MLFNKIATQMGWPFIIIYIALIICITYFGFISIPKSFKTKNWIEVSGKVTDSHLVKTQKTHRSGKRITAFSANIHYEYIIDGQTYSGSKNRFSERSLNGEKIKQTMLERFPIGATVPVYYNPNNPNESVLVKGLNTIYLFAIGIFLTLIAFMTATILKKI